MRFLMFIAIVALAGCSGKAPQDSTGGGSSGIKIADAALASGTPAVALHVTDGVLSTDPATPMAHFCARAART